MQEKERGASTILTIFLTLIIAGALGVGAYFGYNWWQGQANRDTGLNQPAPTPPPNPTAGWQTYTDTENGFSVKYPADWTKSDGTFPSTHGTTLKDTGFSKAAEKVFLTVRTNPDGTLEAFVNADSVTDIKSAVVDTLNGFAAVAGTAYRVYLGKDTKVYMFTFPNAQSDADLTTTQVNILTSFKFLTSTTTPSTTPTTPPPSPSPTP